MVTSQAAVMGLDQFFYAFTFIFILIIPLIWITCPTKGGLVRSVRGSLSLPGFRRFIVEQGIQDASTVSEQKPPF
jgi:hypothetical protein